MDLQCLSHSPSHSLSTLFAMRLLSYFPVIVPFSSLVIQSRWLSSECSLMISLSNVCTSTPYSRVIALIYSPNLSIFGNLTGGSDRLLCIVCTDKLNSQSFRLEITCLGRRCGLRLALS